jgi:hypothetical protein
MLLPTDEKDAFLRTNYRPALYPDQNGQPVNLATHRPAISSSKRPASESGYPQAGSLCGSKRPASESDCSSLSSYRVWFLGATDSIPSAGVT